jgi:hypothetical protein
MRVPDLDVAQRYPGNLFAEKSRDFKLNGTGEAVDFVRIAVRGVSNGHGGKVVHFCTTFVPIAYDFAECGADMHHMKPFRHFLGLM